MGSKNQIKVKIRFFATLRDVFNSSEVELRLRTAGTIKNLLEALCNSSKRRQELFDQSGNLRPYVKVLKNGRNIDFLGGMDTQLASGDVVAIFPPVGGG
jgi:molybdopterin synthase sulfur carrier subunit